MKTYRKSDSVLRFVRFSSFIVFVAIIAAASYSSSASSSLFGSRGSLPKSTSATNPAGMRNVANGSINVTTEHSFTDKSGGSKFALLGTMGLYSAFGVQALPESIATFATDCATPKLDFNLGESVCAKATGVPSLPFFFQYRVSWISPDGLVVQSEAASTDPNTHYTYSPMSAGTWRVNLTRANGSVRQSAVFTVHNTANVAADVFVQKFARDGNASVPAGSNIAFILIVGNAGPDTAANVSLIDSKPSGSTLVSFTQQSGPACTPASTGNCTMSLANGETAEFTAIYNMGSGAPGTVVTTSASVSNTPTQDPDTSNNTSSAQFQIDEPSGAGTCSLTCPADITANANTTEGGLRGAHVIFTFDPLAGTGNCGSVPSSSPASGSFFAVGTTSVHVTSETGGGTCNFRVTVEDPNGNTTITCPSNKTVTADGNCGATVSLGNPTATGDNVSIAVSRSDGLPMYNCDFNGANCVRKTTDLPFPAGVTTVTWTAFSHDTPGPYANAADEEAHRTGNAECQQTVEVDDVTPPTIIAAPQQVSANASCQAPVPDFSIIAVVSDNCSCASSDTSQVCNSRQNITVTQDVAPGTLMGLGPHTIHLTANDGSSNNDGAGNSTTISVTFTVVDTTPPTILCPASITNVSTEPGICAAHVNVGTATATDNCDNNPTITATRSDSQPLTADYPRGTTTITWTATDASGNHSSCQQTITVVDKESPVIVLNGQTPAIGPPNHKYQTFQITDFVTAVTDNCDSIGVSSVYITKVTSDELENSGSDGNTLNDIVIAANCKSVQLRSERDGTGDGRVYTIFLSVRDAAGNIGTATARVVVQHDTTQTAVDSGPHYTVVSSCP